MNIQSPTFLFSTIIFIMFLFSSFVYADEYPAFTQSNVSINEGNYNNNKDAKQAARQQVENILLGTSFDQLFKYDLGVNKTTGIKVHSSLRLKVRSDHTLLQFKMRF